MVFIHDRALGVLQMRKKLLSLAAVVALAALMGAPVPARATAELIDVHHIKPGKAKGGKPAGSANCSNNDASKETAAYKLTGWAASGGDAHLNVATIPAGLTDVPGALQAAFDVWTGAPRVTVKTDGTVTRYTANKQKDLLFGSTGGSIATTYTWRWNDGTVESDVVFNKGLAWFTASSEGDGCYETVAKYDVRNIAAHEFGHVFGLDHPAGARYETMYAYGYTGETLKWSPTAGDINGIQAVY